MNVELSPEDVSDRIGDIEITVPEKNETIGLADLMKDVTSGHYELSAYKRGALTYCDALDEEIALAEAENDEEAAELLREVRRATFGLYLRVKRGDAEIVGDRDGKHSNFLDSEDEIPEDEPDY